MATSVHVWYLFSPSDFYEILLDACTENTRPGKYPGNGCYYDDDYSYCSPAVQAARWLSRLPYDNPGMTDYIIQVLHWKYPSKPEEGFQRVIDMFPALDLEDPGYGDVYNSSSLYSNIAGSFDDHIEVLELFLGLGLDLGESRLWRGTIWFWLLDTNYAYLYSPDESDESNDSDESDESDAVDSGVICETSTLGACLVNVFLEAGADVDQDISVEELYPSIDNLEDDRCCGRIALLYGREWVKPIEVAFLLTNPSIFFLLMARNADTSSFFPEAKTFEEKDWSILPEIIQAVHARDQILIQKLWNDRTPVNSFKTKFALALRQGTDKTAAQVLIRQCESPPLLLEAFSYFIEIRSEWEMDQPENLWLRQTFQETLLQAARNWDLEFEESQAKVYTYALEWSLKDGDMTMLNLLLDSAKSAILQNLKMQQNLVPFASELWPEGIKVLLQRGFDINDVRIKEWSRDWTTKQIEYKYYSALYYAIDRGGLHLLTSLLSEGANIYAPCAIYPSAVAYAVIQGRIDTVALFLEVEPYCYSLALEATAHTEHRYMIDFVRDWKPTVKSAPDIDTQMIDLTENNE
ncbi:hypothetical protein ABW21_db0206429 [Orbilia brochopaga]|nr:hypothetical protein ABW21_db0206429 [Drechslerella brochopaga]